jgi:hypothetical protein
VRHRVAAAAPLLLAAVVTLTLACPAGAADSLPPLAGGKAPRTLSDLWGDYDPAAEPLEAATVRQWRDGPVVCRHVTYRIGTFKGKPSTMAAFYAFPAEREGPLPSLLHLHGGGQRASLPTVTFATLNGYAALSLNWGAKPMPDARPGDANTDWGALDATQDGHNSHYASMKPDGKTLDAVASPRNNNWFLLTLAARRAITFLAEQPQVDPDRIGVLGHSMGGKLTVDVAGIDRRVAAAAPSCGGSGTAPETITGMPGTGQRSRDPWYLATIDDRPYLARLACPILYCSPTNDFAGPLDAMFANWRGIPSRDVRYAVSPHLNHRHEPEFAVTRFLWFEQHLKGGPALPATPGLAVRLDGPGGVPTATVRPDRPGEVARACVYYAVDPHVLTRFWRSAEARRDGDVWTAPCPVMGTDRPLYVLANVYYPRTPQFTPHRWLNFTKANEFAITSRIAAFTPDDLRKAGVRCTDEPSMMIDDFSRGWRDWYRLSWEHPPRWTAATRKLKDPKWRGEDGRHLALDVRTDRPNTLVLGVELAAWGSHPGMREMRYAAAKRLEGTGAWETVTLRPADLRPVEDQWPAAMPGWRYVTQLSLAARATIERDGREETLGGTWEGPRAFRNLRWVPDGR